MSITDRLNPPPPDHWHEQMNPQHFCMGSKEVLSCPFLFFMVTYFLNAERRQSVSLPGTEVLWMTPAERRSCPSSAWCSGGTQRSRALWGSDPEADRSMCWAWHGAMLKKKAAERVQCFILCSFKVIPHIWIFWQQLAVPAFTAIPLRWREKNEWKHTGARTKWK